MTTLAEEDDWLAGNTPNECTHEKCDGWCTPHDAPALPLRRRYSLRAPKEAAVTARHLP